MADYIYQEMTHAQRVQHLKKLCKVKDQITYTKTLSDTELAAEERQHALSAMRIQQLEDELKTLSAKYKGEIKALKEGNIERLEVIANRKRQVYGQVYGISDNLNKKILFYDESGELVSSRDMFDSEMQGVLFLGENGETAITKEAETSKNILDNFKDAEHAEVVETKTKEPEDYEPSVHEDPPDESDLEQVPLVPSDDNDGGVLGNEEETNGEPDFPPPDEPEEDWRPTDLKEETTKAEKAAGTDKKPRAPRKKKDKD